MSIHAINKDQKTEPIPLSFEYKGTRYSGVANPIKASCNEMACFEMDVVLNSESLGTISRGNNLVWTMKGVSDQGLVDKIGEEITLWYE